MFGVHGASRRHFVELCMYRTKSHSISDPVKSSAFENAFLESKGARLTQNLGHNDSMLEMYDPDPVLAGSRLFMTQKLGQREPTQKLGQQ